MSTITQPAPGSAIPAPPGFALALDADEQRLFWEQDRMHFPRQVTAVEAELMAANIGHGWTHAAGLYAMPVAQMQVRVINGYVYMAAVPYLGTPAEMQARIGESEARMTAAMGRLESLWADELLPEIRAHLAAMEAVDLHGASADALLAHFEDTLARYRRLWEIHFEIIAPAYIAMSEFDELYRDLFDGAGFDAYRLLQGIENKTVEIGVDLFGLSRVALDVPEVLDVLEREAAADVPAALARTEMGRAYLREIDKHLAAYGHRGAMWGLTSKSFTEDPAPVIKVLKDYVAQPDAADPARELERLAAEREAAVAEARAQLAGYPAPVVEGFEALLRAAQTGIALTEDHNFYIDFYGSDCVRQVVVELGRRLAGAGALASADDVFLLTVDEIREAAGRLGARDMRATVAERRSELAAYADVDAPPMLGTLPPGPPPDGPVTRLIAKFFGQPPAPSSDPDLITGAAGSSGALTGVARVVRSLDDAARLKPGEILVAETTAPPWTPLFAVAAAVVTDTGGILSHCAVVAREYGLPAVVGTGRATAAIADGDLVEVDGDAGIVRIIR